MTETPFYIYDTDAPGKGRILREGLRLFAEKGLAATSIRDIADATGMSNPALYKHFKTKNDVALVLFERLYRAHLKRLTVATQNAADFPAKFDAFLVTFLASYDEAPHATIFTTDNLVTLWPDLADDLKSRTVVTLLRELLILGRSTGFVAPDQDIDLQMSLVLGMLGQITRQLYFRTLTGPSKKYADNIGVILRAGLS